MTNKEGYHYHRKIVWWLWTYMEPRQLMPSTIGGLWRDYRLIVEDFEANYVRELDGLCFVMIFMN